MSVPPRRAAAPAPAAPSAAPGSASWPPSLRSYVERAFAAFPASARPALAAALKATIAEAQAKGDVWTRAWDSLPLPDVSVGAPPPPPPQARMGQPPGHPTAWYQHAQPPPPPPPARRHPPSAAAQAAAEVARRRAAALAGSTVLPPPPRLPPPPPGYDLPAAFGTPAPKGKKGKKGRVGDTPATAGKRKRASRWDDDGGDDDDYKQDPVEAARRARRAGRFGAGTADGAPPPRPRGRRAATAAYAGGTGVSGVVSRRAALEALLAEKGDVELDDAALDALAVRGTATILEKSYFRLTAPPDPATVRPEPVLAAALERLVGLMAGRGVTYFYAADQFKGLRQDCTVQRLRGRVTAAVYEAHARAALEYGDAAEFNQCQAQLVGLHAGGAADGDTGAEFLAYRILYQAAHARTSAGERLALLRTLEAAAKAAEEPPVKHALAVRAALARGDAPTFFNLYATAPRLGCALMDVAAPGLRFDTLRVLVAALRPGVPVALAARVLGFGPAPAAADATPARTLPGCSSPRYDGACAPAPDAASAAAAATAWLTAHGAIIVGEGDAAAVDCKASADRLAVPEDDAAVAHGDARLAVDDFLKSF